MRPRTYWTVTLIGIIGLGIGSRMSHTGWVLLDKYLGDALYAAMVYMLLWKLSAGPRAVAAMILMTAIELFQLTHIPARLFASEHAAVRIAARLMGTEFAYADLFSYFVGILAIYCLDRLTCKIVR